MSCLAPIFRDEDKTNSATKNTGMLVERRCLSLSVTNLNQDRCQLCLFNRYDLFPKNSSKLLLGNSSNLNFNINNNIFHDRKKLIINNYQTIKKLSTNQIVSFKKIESYKRQHSDPDSNLPTEKFTTPSDDFTDFSNKRNLVKSTSLNTMQDNYYENVKVENSSSSGNPPYENHEIIRKYKEHSVDGQVVGGTADLNKNIQELNVNEPLYAVVNKSKLKGSEKKYSYIGIPDPESAAEDSGPTTSDINKINNNSSSSNNNNRSPKLINFGNGNNLKNIHSTPCLSVSTSDANLSGEVYTKVWKGPKKPMATTAIEATGQPLWTCGKCSYAYNPMWIENCDICDSTNRIIPASLTQPNLTALTKSSLDEHSSSATAKDNIINNNNFPNKSIKVPMATFEDEDLEDDFQFVPGE